MIEQIIEQWGVHLAAAGALIYLVAQAAPWRRNAAAAVVAGDEAPCSRCAAMQIVQAKLEGSGRGRPVIKQRGGRGSAQG